jgi:hypothetical protein
MLKSRARVKCLGRLRFRTKTVDKVEERCEGLLFHNERNGPLEKMASTLEIGLEYDCTPFLLDISSYTSICANQSTVFY